MYLESDGTPFVMYGQAVYMSFFESGVCHMMIGSDLSTAIRNGAQKRGEWQNSGGTLWWTWSDGMRSDDWSLDSYSGDFSSGNSILKDLGRF